MATVKINMSAAELNKFIGEDSEVAMELKSNVIQEFAKRHLKGIINDDGFKKIERSIRTYFTKQFEKNIGEYKRIQYNNVFVPNDVIKDAIDSYVSLAVRRFWEERETELVSEMLTGKRIKDMEDRIVDRMTERYLKSKRMKLLERVEASLSSQE